MRNQFDASAEKAKLVDRFKEMRIDETISYVELSREMGFECSPEKTWEAREKVEKVHGIYISCTDQKSYKRHDGKEMLDSGYGIAARIKRQAKKMVRRATNAVTKHNLTPEQHRAAMDMITRGGIISDTANIKAESNRPRREAAEKAPPMNLRGALKGITGKRS